MEKQAIRENYHKLLAQYRYMYSDESIMSRPEIKYQYDQVFEELMDTSRKSVGRLTEDETELVRRSIGVYGEKDADVRLTFFLRMCTAALTTRIKHGYVVVKDELLSGKLTRKDLLKLKLIEMDYPVNETNHVWLLHDNGVITVKDYIEASSFLIGRYPALIDYIHSLGLTFEDEELDLETARELKKLISEYESATKEVDELSKTIKEKQTEKKRLQATRKELLDKIENLSYDNITKINRFARR